MVRVTHVEAEGVDVVVDGHHVECSLPRSGAQSVAHTGVLGGSSFLAEVLEWFASVVGCFFEAAGQFLRIFLAEAVNLFVAVLATLLQLCVRTIGAVFAFVLLPVLHEAFCIVGAAVLCPAGALGRYLASAASHAGAVLKQRSLVLVASGRVLAAANRRSTLDHTQAKPSAALPAAAHDTAGLAEVIPRSPSSEPARTLQGTPFFALKEHLLIPSTRAVTRGRAQSANLIRGKG